MNYQEAKLPKLHKIHNHLRKALKEIALFELDPRPEVVHEQAEKMRSIARKALEDEPNS